MSSAIDDTKPESGNATTASVRANFAAAKSEIEALQSARPIGIAPLWRIAAYDWSLGTYETCTPVGATPNLWWPVAVHIKRVSGADTDGHVFELRYTMDNNTLAGAAADRSCLIEAATPEAFIGLQAGTAVFAAYGAPDFSQDDSASGDAICEITVYGVAVTWL